MDSLSQIVLGASVAEVVAGRTIGNRALLWGAIAGTIPDLDVISQFFMDDFLAMTYHRGFSHSLIFCFLFAPLLGWIFQKIHRRRGATFQQGTALAFWCFVTHIALDCCTSWGTQVFWPWDVKVSTNSVFVADPLYTLPFLLLLITLMFFKMDRPIRRKLNVIALALSTGYLLWGMGAKLYVNHQFEVAFAKCETNILQFESRPTPLNTVLWTANAETPDDYLIGFCSIFDQYLDTSFIRVRKNHDLLKGIESDPNVQRVLKMTQGWYAVEQTDSCLVVNDLRFGQPKAWESEPDDFVFQYVLIPNKEGFQVVVPEPPRPNPSEAKILLSSLYKRAMGI